MKKKKGLKEMKAAEDVSDMRRTSRFRRIGPDPIIASKCSKGHV